MLPQEAPGQARREGLLEETDSYLAELIKEVGVPDAEDYAWAQAIARRIARRTHREVLIQRI